MWDLETMKAMNKRANTEYVIHPDAHIVTQYDHAEEGICPECRTPVNYTDAELEDTGLDREITCPNCGFVGHEWYNLVYDSTYKG